MHQHQLWVAGIDYMYTKIQYQGGVMRLEVSEYLEEDETSILYEDQQTMAESLNRRKSIFLSHTSACE
jgi:hypothetical protein